MASVVLPTDKRGISKQALWTLGMLIMLGILIILLSQVLKRTGLVGAS